MKSRQSMDELKEVHQRGGTLRMAPFNRMSVFCPCLKALSRRALWLALLGMPFLSSAARAQAPMAPSAGQNYVETNTVLVPGKTTARPPGARYCHKKQVFQ